VNISIGVDVPDGALEACSIGIFQYVDPSTGEMMYTSSSSGDMPLTTYLGLLELIKHRFLESAGRKLEDEQ
jgi:hypothetical protein